MADAPQLEMVLLHNGAQEPLASVRTTFMALENLWSGGLTGQMAAYDLQAIAAGSPDARHVDAKTKKLLIDHALLTADGSIHSTVKNVVLSSLHGEGGDFSLRRPVAQGPSTPAKAGTGRFASLAGLGLAAASAGLGFLGMPKAEAATGDAAALASFSGARPMHDSPIQKAADAIFESVNEIMPRSASDIARVPTKVWDKIAGNKSADQNPASPGPQAPISR
jgi:hypothetical protein